MNLPFRRRSRPRGPARLALTGDFPATDHDITEAIQAIPPAPWDGTTVPLSALRDQPHYMPPGVEPYPRGHFTGIGADTTWHPAPVREDGTPAAPRPARVLPMPQARAVMTVYPAGPGVPAPSPEALDVVRYLHAKVRILKQRGQRDRISEEKVRLVPGDRATNRRTTARLIVDDAAELLRYGGDPS